MQRVRDEIGRRHVVVATLLYNRHNLLDVYGPLEMILGANIRYSYINDAIDIVTISTNNDKLVRPTGGPQTITDHTIATIPEHIDVLWIPGGDGVADMLNDKKVMEAVMVLIEKATVVCTVSNGAMVLAETGALKGKSATMHKAGFRDGLEKRYKV